MDAQAGPRIGWQWIAAAITAGAVLFLNLDGYHTGYAITFRGHGDFYGEPPYINWTHGWPFVVAVRLSIYRLAAGKGVPLPVGFPGERGYYSRWPIDEAPLVSFYWLPLVLDLAILAVLVTGAWLAVRRIAGRWPLRLRFHLKFLFLMTLLVAVVVGSNVFSYATRYTFQYAAFGIVALAALATVLWRMIAAIEWLMRGLKFARRVGAG